MAETVWPTEPKIFTLRHFIEKACLPSSGSRSQAMSPHFAGEETEAPGSGSSGLTYGRTRGAWFLEWKPDPKAPGPPSASSLSLESQDLPPVPTGPAAWDSLSGRVAAALTRDAAMPGAGAWAVGASLM